MTTSLPKWLSTSLASFFALGLARALYHQVSEPDYQAIIDDIECLAAEWHPFHRTYVYMEERNGAWIAELRLIMQNRLLFGVRHASEELVLRGLASKVRDRIAFG